MLEQRPAMPVPAMPVLACVTLNQNSLIGLGWNATVDPTCKQDLFLQNKSSERNDNCSETHHSAEFGHYSECATAIWILLLNYNVTPCHESILNVTGFAKTRHFPDLLILC